MNLKHPVVLVAQLLMVSVVFTDKNHEETKAVESDKDGRAAAPEQSKWIDLLSAAGLASR